MHHSLIEKGDTVYVAQQKYFSDSNNREPLQEHIVVEANKSSFYTVPRDEHESGLYKKYKCRFKQSTLKHVSSVFGFQMQAYRSPEEYERAMYADEQKVQLTSQIQKELSRLPLDKLIKINELIRG